MDKNWLHQYLSDAVGRRLCAKIGCTTCGAYDFRNGVYRALERSRGATLPLDKSEAAREVVIALAQLTPEVHEWMQIRFEDAVRCLLYDLWYGRPAHVDGLEVLLEESWAGAVLQSMKEHHARMMEGRRARAEYESPEAVRQRKAEKFRIKHEAHIRRLELKLEKDRVWRELHGNCVPPHKRVVDAEWGEDMNSEQTFERVGELIAKACDIAREYKKLTGKPLGITGEVAEYKAARILGLELAPARTPGYDAQCNGLRYQIKGRVIDTGDKRGQRMGSIRLDHEWEFVLLVILDGDLQLTEIWQAERSAVVKELAKPGSKARERGVLSVSTFTPIAQRLWFEGELIRAKPQPTIPMPASQIGSPVCYSATRLMFKKAIIDPLGMDEQFEIKTPEGLYRFTKSDFYEVFDNVVSSASYSSGRGVYSYPSTPKVAKYFLVEPDDV